MTNQKDALDVFNDELDLETCINFIDYAIQPEKLKDKHREKVEKLFEFARLAEQALENSVWRPCHDVDFGTYENTTSLPRPKHMYPTDRGDWITVDNCMIPEILDLWKKGVWTLECCCGHGKKSGYIAVIDEHMKIMDAIGYDRDKNTTHVYVSKTNCLPTHQQIK